MAYFFKNQSASQMIRKILKVTAINLGLILVVGLLAELTFGGHNAAKIHTTPAGSGKIAAFLHDTLTSQVSCRRPNAG